MWIVIIVLLGIALMIPITAILLDSPLGRSMARRLEGPTDGAPGSVRASPVRPAPNTAVSAGANAIPITASTPVASSNRPRIAPASARAAPLSARALSAA